MGKNNQKTVTVFKEPTDTKRIYAKISIAAMDEAKKNLNDGAFLLWLYFAKNQDKYCFDLSSKAIERDFNIKKGQYSAAIKELTDKRYLIDVNTDPDAVANLWEFHEKPVPIPAPPINPRDVKLKVQTVRDDFSFLDHDENYGF